jgi:hypothetical protein
MGFIIQANPDLWLLGWFSNYHAFIITCLICSPEGWVKNSKIPLQICNLRDVIGDGIVSLDVYL